jgi:hypothetical protein
MYFLYLQNVYHGFLVFSEGLEQNRCPEKLSIGENLIEARSSALFLIVKSIAMDVIKWQ